MGIKTATNPITGDKIQSRPQSKAYQDNYDAIFNKKPEPLCEQLKSQQRVKHG